MISDARLVYMHHYLFECLPMTNERLMLSIPMFLKYFPSVIIFFVSNKYTKDELNSTNGIV